MAGRRAQLLTAAASPSTAAIMVRALSAGAGAGADDAERVRTGAEVVDPDGSVAVLQLATVDGDESDNDDRGGDTVPLAGAAAAAAAAAAAQTTTATGTMRRASSGSVNADLPPSAPDPPPAVPSDADDAAGVADDSKGWLMPYWRLLRSNREYRVLFIGNIISGLGDWFNIIASLSVLSASDGSALALALYTGINSLPALVLGPLIGVITDRYDKKTLIILSLIVRALTVVGLVFCQTPETLPGMYVLTFIKYTFSAIYQPVRTAIVPAVVTKRQLVLANGLDGIVWSCMLFIGGAAGGFATSLFGITVAYILDGIAYLIAAYVLGFLLVKGGPFLPFTLLGASVSAGWRAVVGKCRQCGGRGGGARGRGPEAAYGRMGTVMAGVDDDENDEEEDDDDAVPALKANGHGDVKRADHGRDDEAADAFGVAIELQPVAAGSDDAALEDVPVEASDVAGTGDKAGAASGPASGPVSAPEGVGGSGAQQSSWRMIADGFKYMWLVRYVFAICFYKGTLNLGLSIVDMMNVRSAQTVFAIGDNGALSVGINYMVTGTGTIIQPILIRRFVKQTPRNIQFLLLAALLQLSLGATALFFSRQYHWFILSNLFRSGSTSIGLIYSSLVLQQVVPGPVRGRVFSFEQTISTICNVAARVVAGIAIDTWGWTIFQVDGLAAAVTLVCLVGWAIYFAFSRKHVAVAYKTDDLRATAAAA